MTIEQGNVFTGARAVLKLGGVAVGYATNVSWSEEIEQTPIEVLGALEVVEHVPTAYRVTFTAQWVRIVGQPIKNRDAINIFPKFSDILTTGEITAVIEDRLNNQTPVATVQGVKAARYNIAVPARGNVFTDCEFVGRRLSDEADISGG